MTTGFALALPGYRFSFPRDAGSHPAYASEWWYYTGHLHGPAGEFGFELTFFRVGLRPHPVRRTSRWATNNLYLAHFALSDIDHRRFEFAEKVDRGAMGISGASQGHEDAWIDDWRAVQSPPMGQSGQTGQAPVLWPHHLTARAPFGEIALDLDCAKPAVIEGQDGVSQKGPQVGQASHYYSYTRLIAHGQLRRAGKLSPVSGTAWMDHEFGSAQLSADEVGWDWFSLQLGDGWDLMLYRIRLAGGGESPYSSGTLVAPDGRGTFIPDGAFKIRAVGTWKSPESNAVYPAGWQIGAPGYGLDLRVVPQIDDQELQTRQSTGIDYWEGACSIAGTHQGARVSGQGYTELTGYDTPVTSLD